MEQSLLDLIVPSRTGVPALAVTADVPADADALAMHLLMRSQGVATLAAALRDEDFIEREVQAMSLWLDAQCPAAPLHTA